MISQPTQDFYNVIKNLSEDSIIIWEEGGISGQYDVNRPPMVAAIKLIFSSNIKLVIFCDSGHGPILMKDVLDRVQPEKNYGKTYGEDYVLFGFAAGGESATASFATDIRKTFATDYYGTPIENIPLMKNINNANDIDLIIQMFVGCYNCDWVVRQWVVPYGTVYLGITPECCAPMIAAYYPASCVGYLSGIMGATELEIISKTPGEGATVSDAKNLGLIPMIIFIILGNIAYFSEKLGKKEEKK